MRAKALRFASCQEGNMNCLGELDGGVLDDG